MPCEWLKDEKTGAVMHINYGRGGGKKKPCPFCKRGWVSKLCDYPVGNGKTCDAEICDSCTTQLGHQNTPLAPGSSMVRLNDTIDVCPIHKGQPFPEEVA